AYTGRNLDIKINDEWKSLTRTLSTGNVSAFPSLHSTFSGLRLCFSRRIDRLPTHNQILIEKRGFSVITKCTKEDKQHTNRVNHLNGSPDYLL
ncbi:hypothetical protein, partial [Halalkalibacterium halodurans]|uniref:hypothetical protein n=1 Tax=Halalkalibacterium halodurans TaxID=86665 RepID=UPI002E1DFC4F|nr:hypothetical protein [Halalkalibacterium halodurans]